MTEGFTDLIGFVHQITQAYAAFVFFFLDHVLSKLTMVNFLVNRAAGNTLPLCELCRRSISFGTRIEISVLIVQYLLLCVRVSSF